MGNSTKKRFHISMDLTRVDDKKRHDIVAGIVQLAATSPLIANQAIQASVTALGTLGAALKADNDMVAADKTRMASSVEMEANSRSAIDCELLSLKALVENKATKSSDIASMGFEERGDPPPKTQVTPPESIDIRPHSRLRGQFTASARESGSKTRWRYAAEWSPDPMSEKTWAALPGYSKTRKVTSPSGTRVWVRFARVRGQVQSEWSTPVLVTTP